MSTLSNYIKRQVDLIEIFRLYRKQPWLLKKEDNLAELIKICKNKNEKALILNLLGEFNFLSGEDLSKYLGLISDYIIGDSSFLEKDTQVSALTYDDEADSSQKILDQIKMPLFKKGWHNVKTVNRYGAIIKNFNRGYKQIVLIDEFIGSGQTILGRLKQLNNDIGVNFDVKICFLAGMDYAIKIVEDQGYEVFCPLRLPKGIRDRFTGELLEEAINDMFQLELRLASKINDYELENYSFGYNAAESLYSLEGCQGNTPNSVFPLFWWPKSISGEHRNTLLTRFEKGLK